MTELSPETRALLTKGGDVTPMSASHRARLKRAVVAKVAVGATVITTSASAAAGASGLGAIAGKVVAIGAIVGLIGGAGVAWRRAQVAAPHGSSAPTARPRAPERGPETTAETTAPASATAEPPPAPAPPDPRAGAPPRSVIDATQVTPPRQATPGPRVATRIPPPDESPPSSSAAVPPVTEAPGADTGPLLREEARLLRDAHQALNAGDALRALDLLDNHAATFPRGVLEPERSAERVFALCRAGRHEEARRASERFLAVERPALLAARVRASCAALKNE